MSLKQRQRQRDCSSRAHLLPELPSKNNTLVLVQRCRPTTMWRAASGTLTLSSRYILLIINQLLLIIINWSLIVVFMGRVGNLLVATNIDILKNYVITDIFYSLLILRGGGQVEPCLCFARLIGKKYQIFYYVLQLQMLVMTKAVSSRDI